jgi:Pla-1/cef family extracellular lipase
MKKMLLTIAVATGLYGCGESLEDVNNEAEAVIPTVTGSVPFDPANGVIAVPNDLLFLGTTDGTLNIPSEAAPVPDYVDPQTSLGALDGWSTQSAYQIPLELPAGLELDASTVNGDSVRIYEVVMGASRIDQDCTAAPAGFVCKYVRELTFGVDYVAQASGNSIAILPIKPFSQQASYINVVTNSLTDTTGESFAPSSTYGLVKLDFETLPLVTDSQRGLQAVINSYEDAVIQSGTVTKDEIIYTAAMTIQSTGSVLGMIKNVYASTVNTAAMPSLVMGPSTGLTVGDVLFGPGGAVDPSIALFYQVQYERGSVNLNQFLKAPTGTADSDLNNTYWQGMCDSGATLAGYAAQGGGIPSEAVSENDAACMAASGGTLRDLGFDQLRHLTKFNPLPKTQSIANVPVQVTTPPADLSVVNAVRASLGLPALVKPATGWPVTMLQHGITGTKESMLAITTALTLQGFVTVAIDHPIHGERGIDADNDGNVDFIASGANGNVLHYMNLSSNLVARDNLRQSSADLIGLRLSLAATNLPDINPTDVTFVGHSLGAVVAPAFLAATNDSLASVVGEETAAMLDPLFKVNTVALGSGSGGLASFLLDSGAFGNVIKSQVLFAAGTAESQDFLALLDTQEVKDVCAASELSLTDCATYAYTVYVTQLATAQASGDATAQQKLANIAGVMGQFAFAIQTAVDSADGVSYGSKIASQGTAVYQNVVIGDGNANLEDTVIPATTSTSLVAGTVPSALLMGLTPVATTQQSETPMSYLVKFTKGHHGSLLTPAPSGGATAAEAAAATAEMQGQVASFLASRGLVLQVANESIVTQ